MGKIKHDINGASVCFEKTRSGVVLYGNFRNDDVTSWNSPSITLEGNANHSPFNGSISTGLRCRVIIINGVVFVSPSLHS